MSDGGGGRAREMKYRGIGVGSEEKLESRWTGRRYKRLSVSPFIDSGICLENQPKLVESVYFRYQRPVPSCVESDKNYLRDRVQSRRCRQLPASHDETTTTLMGRKVHPLVMRGAAGWLWFFRFDDAGLPGQWCLGGFNSHRPGYLWESGARVTVGWQV